MNLLFSNDRRGEYPASWYAATAEAPGPFPVLQGAVRADVCVVGGGYTGVSAALHLAEAGLSVVLVEAHRVGFGASGRNGGQLGSGQRQDQVTLEEMIGRDEARHMWDLGEDAKALVRNLVARHGIDCHLKDGVAWAGRSEGSVRELHAYADHMDRHYGYEHRGAGPRRLRRPLPLARLPGWRARHGCCAPASAAPRSTGWQGRRRRPGRGSSSAAGSPGSKRASA